MPDGPTGEEYQSEVTPMLPLMMTKMTKMMTLKRSLTWPFPLTPMMPLVGSCWAVTKIVSALILQVRELKSRDCTTSVECVAT